MAGPTPIVLDNEVYALLQRACQAGKVALFTDPAILNRQGSPLFSPMGTFVPPLVLLASSLTLLFAFGLVEWMIGLLLALMLQFLLIRRVNEYLFHRRAKKAALSNLHNFLVIWSIGGLVLALKDWPDKNCAAPDGNWRAFVMNFLSELPETSNDKT